VDPHGNGNWGLNDPPIDTTAFRLYTKGELTAQAERAIGTFTLSPDPATYRLGLHVARDADSWLTDLHKPAPPGPCNPRVRRNTRRALPLLTVDYDMKLNPLNTTPHPRDRQRPATIGAGGPPTRRGTPAGRRHTGLDLL
jgi:hypothetical protein